MEERWEGVRGRPKQKSVHMGWRIEVQWDAFGEVSDEIYNGGDDSLDKPDNYGGHNAEGGGREGDQPRYTLTPEDLCLRDVYRYWVHTSNGGSLSGGIVGGVT